MQRTYTQFLDSDLGWISKLLVACWLVWSPLSGQAQISISSGGVAVTQDFNTLAVSGTSSVVPAGWAFSETGASANSSYSTGTGTDNTGDTYSFGGASSADRAFGGLRSSNLETIVGAAFINNTGRTITELSIRYQGETWRVGNTNRADQLDFQYSLSATSLTAGTYTDFNVLDYVNTGQSQIATGTTLPVQSTQVSGNITQLSIPAGATFWIRWTDLDVAGADDGMGIDDFSLTATTSGPPAPTATLTPAPATLSGFSTTQGTASAQQQFTLTGQNLNGSNVTLTPPTNYELSLTSGAGFTATPLVLSAYAGSSTMVYVRLSGSGLGQQGTAGTPVTIAIVGGGATAATVALSGTVAAAPVQTAPEPTVQPAVTVGNITSGTADFTLSGGNGQKRLLVLRPASASVFTPADNATYAASLALGTSNRVGASYILVADGTTTAGTLTGLTANRAYVLEVYAYNDNTLSGQENYLTPNPGNYSFSTAQTPLPVELLDFRAERQAATVQVRWATASEHNSVRFEVQRSADGRRFETVATVAAQGSSSQRRQYAWVDARPLPALAYYRLRQIDLDGTATYSPAVAVDAVSEMLLYPNPAYSELHLHSVAPGARYRVLSLLGQVVLQGEASNGAVVLDVAALPAGIYQLEIYAATGRQVRKFLKSN